MRFGCCGVGGGEGFDWTFFWSLSQNIEQKSFTGELKVLNLHRQIVVTSITTFFFLY